MATRITCRYGNGQTTTPKHMLCGDILTIRAIICENSYNMKEHVFFCSLLLHSELLLSHIVSAVKDLRLNYTQKQIFELFDSIFQFSASYIYI